jgi:hypothetical protein
LTESRRRALERWLVTDDNDKKITRVKDEIKLLLYNKRNIAIETQNIIEPGSKKNKTKSIKRSNCNKTIKDCVVNEIDKKKRGRPKSVVITKKNILVTIKKNK